MLDIELDGKKVQVKEGSVVMHAADAAGVVGAIPIMLNLLA